MPSQSTSEGSSPETSEASPESSGSASADDLAEETFVPGAPAFRVGDRVTWRGREWMIEKFMPNGDRPPVFARLRLVGDVSAAPARARLDELEVPPGVTPNNWVGKFYVVDDVHVRVPGAECPTCKGPCVNPELRELEEENVRANREAREVKP